MSKCKKIEKSLEKKSITTEKGIVVVKEIVLLPLYFLIDSLPRCEPIHAPSNCKSYIARSSFLIYKAACFSSANSDFSIQKTGMID